jgi:hypothetical protein
MRRRSPACGRQALGLGRRVTSRKATVHMINQNSQELLTKLELRYRLKSQDAATLAGVLAQCQELAHLNLCDNDIEAAGAESLAGVLGQCPALAHLDLSRNVMEARNAGEDLSRNEIGAGGAESLPGVLGHCLGSARAVRIPYRSPPCTLLLSESKQGAPQ